MPSGSPHPPPRPCSRYLRPRILCPSGVKLTATIYTGLSPRSILKTDMRRGWGAAPEQQSGSVDGGQIWGWGIHTHANNTLHCVMFVLLPQALRGESAQGHRLGSASPLPPKLLASSTTPPSTCKGPPTLVVLHPSLSPGPAMYLAEPSGN